MGSFSTILASPVLTWIETFLLDGLDLHLGSGANTGPIYQPEDRFWQVLLGLSPRIIPPLPFIAVRRAHSTNIASLVNWARDATILMSSWHLVASEADRDAQHTALPIPANSINFQKRWCGRS